MILAIDKMIAEIDVNHDEATIATMIGGMIDASIVEMTVGTIVSVITDAPNGEMIGTAGV